MDNSANKKVTFKEPPDNSEGGNGYPPKTEEEPYITLNELPESCPRGVPTDFDLVNPCLAGEPKIEIQTPKNPSDLKKALPCTQALSEMPSEGGSASFPEIVPKTICSGGKETASDPSETIGSTGRSAYDGVSAHQRLADKLKEMVIEEEFRRETPTMRRQLFKYRGICGTVGNPVFTNTPVAPPEYQARLPARRIPGYPRPVHQHPFYSTTSAGYGAPEPYFESTPIVYYPDDQSFTIRRAVGGAYEDAHLTTELDKDPMW